VDFVQKELKITGSVRRCGGALQRRSPKTQSSIRTLPVPTILLNVLRQHRVRQDAAQPQDDWQEHGLVFPSSVGTLMEPGNLHRQFKTVLKRAGLPTTIRFHDLRHSCATLLLDQGVPLVIVRDMLGHTQISTTADIYGHVLPDSQRKAADGLDTLLGDDTDGNEAEDEDEGADGERDERKNDDHITL
jgi:integrase